jgi:hypothetical protein
MNEAPKKVFIIALHSDRPLSQRDEMIKASLEADGYEVKVLRPKADIFFQANTTIEGIYASDLNLLQHGFGTSRQP